MKLAVIGATGRSGVPLVKQALDKGHEVVAVVRSKGKLHDQQGEHDNLHVVEGDATNYDVLDKAVRDVDAVISVIGHVKGSPKDLQTDITRKLVKAMKAHDVSRVVSLTGAGVKDPQDEPKLIDHMIRFALKTFAGDVLKDAQNHAEVLRQSDLDWTMARGPLLSDGAYTGEYRVGYVGKGSGSRLARADLADFLLKEVRQNSYLHQAPMISN